MCPKTLETMNLQRSRGGRPCLTKNVNNKYPKLGKVLTECKIIADLSLSRSTLQVSAQGQSDEGIAGKWPHFPVDHKLACNK